MGGSSSSYEPSESDTNYKVARVTTEAIFEITRKHDLDDEVDKLLKEAALEIHEFDRYRDNMQIRAYGEKEEDGTVIITAGKGENVLEVQTDGEDKIKCTWAKYSTKARIFKVVLPKLVNFIKDYVPRLVGAVAGGTLGISSVGNILKPLTQ